MSVHELEGRQSDISGVTPLGLGLIRNEILEALRESVTEFKAEVELYQTQSQYADTAIRLKWMVENAQEAISDIRIFFAKVRFYSKELMPYYIWISCIFKDADAGNSGLFWNYSC